MLIFTSRRFCLLALAALVVACAAAPTAVTTLAAQQQGTPKQLIVAMRVTDKKDVPLTDIQASELEVKENGKAVAVQAVELDKRPLALALVLDNNTELSTSFMQSVVPAGVALVKALPEGTTIDVWTSGDRPSRVAKSVDAAAAETALKGIAAIGTNALLNTMAEASQALPTDDTHRTAVVVFTGSTLGDSGGYEQSIKATSTKPTFVGLELFLAHPDSRIENALEMFAAQTGGYFDRILSVTAFEKRAPAVVTLLNGMYRVAWQPSGDPRETKFEFKCSRKGAKVVTAQRMSAVW
jgi:hypothetical protein